MMGGSMIYQQIGGNIKSKSGQSLLVYTKEKERNKIDEQIEMDMKEISIKKHTKGNSRKVFDNLED